MSVGHNICRLYGEKKKKKINVYRPITDLNATGTVRVGLYLKHKPSRSSYFTR